MPTQTRVLDKSTVALDNSMDRANQWVAAPVLTAFILAGCASSQPDDTAAVHATQQLRADQKVTVEAR